MISDLFSHRCSSLFGGGCKDLGVVKASFLGSLEIDVCSLGGSDGDSYDYKGIIPFIATVIYCLRGVGDGLLPGVSLSELCRSSVIYPGEVRPRLIVGDLVKPS